MSHCFPEGEPTLFIESVFKFPIQKAVKCESSTPNSHLFRKSFLFPLPFLSFSTCLMFNSLTYCIRFVFFYDSENRVSQKHASEHDVLTHCLWLVLSQQIWDKTSLECLKVLTGHTGSVLCLQYDERVIVTGSSDSTVRWVVWLQWSELGGLPWGGEIPTTSSVDGFTHHISEPLWVWA